MKLLAAGMCLIGGGTVGWKFRQEIAVRTIPTGWLIELRDRQDVLGRWAWFIFEAQKARWEAREESRFDARGEELRSELYLECGHAWAGKYSDNYATLMLGAHGSFYYAASGCEWSERNIGEIVCVDEHRVRLSVSPESAYFAGPARQFFRVLWRGQHFLISRGRFCDFANQVNRGEWATPYWNLRRIGDPVTDEPALPQVPEEFDAMILKQPLHATVTNVLARNQTANSPNCYEALLELRADDGAQPFVGMELYPVDPEAPWGAARVSELRSNSFIASVSNCFNDGEPVKLPELNFEFSSVDSNAASGDPFREIADGFQGFGEG